MAEVAEWTELDLALIQSLDAAGMSIGAIARRLGRTEDEIRGRLPLVRQRAGGVPEPE